MFGFQLLELIHQIIVVFQLYENKDEFKISYEPYDVVSSNSRTDNDFFLIEQEELLDTLQLVMFNDGM